MGQVSRERQASQWNKESVSILQADAHFCLLLKVLLPTPFFLCYSAVAEVSRIAEASSFQWRLQTGWIESGSNRGGGQSCVAEIK